MGLCWLGTASLHTCNMLRLILRRTKLLWKSWISECVHAAKRYPSFVKQPNETALATLGDEFNAQINALLGDLQGE